MQWVMKKRSYWEFGELLNPGVKTLIYATNPYTRCHSTNSTWVEVTDTTYVPWCMLPTGLRKPFVPSCGAFSLKMPLYIDMYMRKKAPGKS